MKKYIPGTLALTLMYIFLALAVTFGVKALADCRLSCTRSTN